MLVQPLPVMQRCLHRAAHEARNFRKRTEVFLHAFYYRYVFARRGPLASYLRNKVDAWEHRHQLGDIPLPPQTWSKDYEAGRWAFLHNLDELGRYSVLAGYMHRLKPGGAFLDVGCGDGLLFHHYRSYGYARYLGLDISDTAVASLAAVQNAATTFICADAENYAPDESFDIIVFNESLYYFHDPIAAAQRYARALRPDGVLLVSSYMGSARARAILRALKRHYVVVDETQIRHGAHAWTCTVLGKQSTLQGR